MNNLKNIGEFIESAQASFDNACLAFSENNVIAPITKATGIKKLTDKLNPQQPHKLSVMELKILTKATGDFSLIHSLMLSLDMVAVNVSKEGKEETLVKRGLSNSVLGGELAELIIDAAGEKRLPKRKANKMLSACHAGITNLVLLANDLENKTQGITPFLSMSLDFIAQGNPLPGLS